MNPISSQSVPFRFFACLGLALLLLAPAAASAQDDPVASQEEAAATQDAPGAAHDTPVSNPDAAAEDSPTEGLLLTVPEAARAPDGSFDAEAATRAYLDRLSPEEKERSDAYFEGGYWLQLWAFLYGLGVAWLLLGTGLSARMRDWAEGVTRFPLVHSALYAMQYTLLTSLLGLPFALYQGYFREHAYDLSNQTLAEWFRDQGIGLLLGVLFSAIAVAGLYWVFRVAPKTWWIWGAAGATAFLALMLLILPVFINPLFNTYTRLEDPTVQQPILRMARENGVPADNVWISDASRQSSRISANVSGFLGTERITLNDNLLNRTSLPEIKAVMGHEIGHYVLNHIYEMLIYAILVIAVGFAFVSWAFDRVSRSWGKSWGIRGIADPAGLPLLTALLSVYFLVMTPVMNTIIRTNEVEADRFGLEAAREPEGFAEVSLKLGEYRKLDPGPVEEFLFFDHPSGKNRILMAMRWKAEHLDDAAGAAANDTSAANALPVP